MKPHLTTILASSFFLAVLGLVIWFGIPDAQNTSRGDRVFVVTSIYPLADFAENIGGNFVYVSSIVPAGAEPHDYEPAPREVGQVLEADVLVYIGGGLDTWVEEVSDETTERGGRVLKMSEVVTFASDGENVDPHAWLDPVLAQEMVTVIRDALIAADPEHTEQFTLNAAAYIQALRDLDVSYSAALKKCDLNDIIVSHDAFGYLARRYDFNILPITGLSPEAEPSVRDLSVLAREAEERGITTIFFETLVSPELAETLAKEVGATTAVLNPLEGLSPEELQAGDNYLSVMQKNREALSSAMLCQ